MKRIFIAVDVSADARREAALYIENLRRAFPRLRVGWEREEKLHLTLKFLGDVDDAQLECVTEAVAKAAKKCAKFKLQIVNTGVFPNSRRARVLWLGVRDEDQGLAQLQRILENECKSCGFVREKRRFSAHLTVARLREPENCGALAVAHSERNFVSDEFEVSEIVIYQSRLLPGGSRYTVVSKHELRAEK
jgi:RNA 2',3'-cyclic 3'-phosphodiesterase